MTSRLPAPARAALIRIGQIALTFVLFAICNELAVKFEVENGVSILFPATAIAILSFMQFGPWAAVGIVLGTIATPWGAFADMQGLVASGIISAIEGLIPWAVFRWRRDLHSELSDMKSLITFLIFGCIVNTAASAILGNLFVVNHPTGLHLNWVEIFVWWIADFVAALLLATPILAFGGALLGRYRESRTLANTLQILTTIVLLGWISAFAIRTYLDLSIEETRLVQERTWSAATDASSSRDSAQSLRALRQTLERADSKRHKITVVVTMIDALVLLILVMASATLLMTVSHPFAQLRASVQAMREGTEFDSSRISTRYIEFRSLAETLEETAHTLRSREEELRLQTEAALAASRHKSDFLAKMSHELRTPLNSIIGFSELLLEQAPQVDPARRAAFLQNVANSARHLLGLINDLLDIAKVESGKMSMRFQSLDLRAAVQNTVASTAPLFDRKRQRVEVSMPAEPMMVRADPARVEQVLLNLLSNANKFSPEGDRITISTTADATRVKIEIADRGIGISEEDRERIFGEFEQVHSTGSLSAGTGLGLALAKRFIEAQGGTIEVESTVGEGSVFRLLFPRA